MPASALLPATDLFPASVITAVRQFHIDAMLDLLDEAAEIRLYDGPHSLRSTACWRWSDDPRPGQHVVLLGADYRHQMPDSLRDDEYAQAQLATALVRHEFGHAAYTSRDLPALNRACESLRVPFGLLNLFEDARIEHLSREAGMGERFGWDGVTAAPTLPDDGSLADVAGFVLSAAIYHEGDADAISRTTACADLRVQRRVIDHYFQRIIQADSTTALLPLASAWVNEFGQSSAQQTNSGQGEQGDGQPPVQQEGAQEGKDGSGPASSPGSVGDLLAAMDLSDADVASLESLSERLEASVVGHGAGEGGGAEVEHAQVDRRYDGPQGFDPLESDAEALIESTTQRPLETDAAERFAALMARRWAGAARKQRSSSSGTFNASAYAGQSRHVWDRPMRGDFRRPRRIVLACDLSGSMSGEPVRWARSLVYAFGLLAKQGVIEGYLLTHKIECGRLLSSVANLRRGSAVVHGMVADGDAEGIHGASVKHRALLQQADHTFWFTDGCICDREIAPGHWDDMGIAPYGVYVGKGDYRDSLEQWFPCSVSATDLDLLLDTLLGWVRIYR